MLFNKIYKLIFLAFLLYLGADTLLAQPKLNAYLSNNLMLIGDQLILYLDVEADDTDQIKWPELAAGDALGPFEVVKVGAIDSTDSKTNPQQKKLVQPITLTIFEEGKFSVPPLTLAYTTQAGKGGQIRTNSFQVTVQETTVDLQQEIKPIKPPLDAPLTLAELLPYLLGGLVLLLLLIGAYIAWRKYHKQQQASEESTPAAPVLPAHIVAFKRLDKLKEDKYWQTGKIKTYYSELSEIVREYLENRYNINALEQTTNEIAQALRKTDLSKELKNDLNTMLSMADLVKFAKAKPAAEQHLKAYEQAHHFVQTTKEQIPPSTENEVSNIANKPDN